MKTIFKRRPRLGILEPRCQCQRQCKYVRLFATQAEKKDKIK